MLRIANQKYQVDIKYIAAGVSVFTYCVMRNEISYYTNISKKYIIFSAKLLYFYPYICLQNN